MNARNAETTEFDALAQVWHDAWHDAHAAIVPLELSIGRTVGSFRERLPGLTPDMRVVGEIGVPLGLCIIKDDELNQLFVARHARGTGVAADLLSDGEDRLASRGIQTAWLACAVGNERAARFYEKSGWHLAQTFVSEIPLTTGVCKLDVWRYEKVLEPRS